MGDLFHSDVTLQQQRLVFSAMLNMPQHTYMILTKRPLSMHEVMNQYFVYNDMEIPDNWWLGVTAENQRIADGRIPRLLQIPAAVRFVSVEPMLAPLDLEKNIAKHILIKPIAFLDWVICGPETGPGKRPFDLQWAWSLYDQCRDAGVPFFAKSDDMVATGFPREWPKTSQISVKGAGNSDILFGSQSKGDRELTDLI